MKEEIMACFGRECIPEDVRIYGSPEAAKEARLVDKKLTRTLKEYYKEDLKKIKLLLLGTGESGKSTITKQMRIIHVNGFDSRERTRKITHIRRNIKESIVAILSAMQQLRIDLEKEDNRSRMEFVLQEALRPDGQVTSAFLDHTEILWLDGGVQECYSRSNEYQLIDSARYFLDRVAEIRQDDYVPSDQDILRCRITTTCIQNIEFDVPDKGHMVKFSVFDVGGQRGERKKWIQVFDSVVAILFLADCSSFDLSLREDSTKNRLIEALEIFEQVWKNRFLKYVSILLFINKIDILADKVGRGRCIGDLVSKYPEILPDYESFVPSNGDKIEFLDSFQKPDHESKKRRGSRSSSKSSEVNPEVVKTAVYVKNLFLKIVKGTLSVRPSVKSFPKDWHQHHNCEYFYTCAVDTNNIQRVLDGCRTLIIRKHLERFGII